MIFTFSIFKKNTWTVLSCFQKIILRLIHQCRRGSGLFNDQPPRLALPAPADAEGHEAEPEAPGSEAPEASPTGDTPKEKVPQSPEVRMESR